MAWAAYATWRLDERAERVWALVEAVDFDEATERRREWIVEQTWIPQALAIWLITATAQPENVNLAKLETPEAKRALVEGTWPELKSLRAEWPDREAPLPIPLRAANLESIRIVGCSGSDLALSSLPPIPGLKELDVVESGELAVTIGSPSRFPLLERLSLRRVSDLENAWSAIGALPKLRELDIFDSDTGSLSGLRLANSLQRLRLEVSRIDAAGTEALSGLTRLRQLTLDSRSVDWAALRRFGLPRNLESLEVRMHARLSSEAAGTYLDVLKTLAGLERLRVLKIEYQGSAEELKAVATIPNLEELTILTGPGAPLNEAAALGLSGASGLRRLKFDAYTFFVGEAPSKEIQLSAAMGATLRGLHRLESLEGGDASTDFFAALAEHSALRNMELWHSLLGDEEAALIERIPRLEQLKVHNPRISGKGPERLSELLRRRGGNLIIYAE